jgi:hypothetical protein
MKSLLAALVLAALPLAAHAQKISVTAGKTDLTNVVVAAPLPPGGAAAPNSVTLPDGMHVPAQVTRGSMPKKDATTEYLVFVLPKLKAGETIEVTPTMLNYVVAPPQFAFIEKKGEPTELVYGGVNGKRKVLQFFNLPHDAKDHYYTFKPFHNIYDPEQGELILSSGSAKSAKDGLYPHHRGLFFGFNRISYGDKLTADIWHGHDNVYSQYDKTLATEVGEVIGRQRVAISWHGKDGQTFANEEREVTAYAVPGGTLIDWCTTLSTQLDKVRLDGDPQHAGFHFRAHPEVSKNGKENTHFLRPDGKGKPGETRNWDAKSRDPKTVNQPWTAMSFVVSAKRYTMLRVNHPDNPKEWRGSEREYGRFGDYFEYDLTPANPLRLKYRIWLQEGEMTVEQCAALAASFTSPPAVKVAGK